MMGVRKNQGSRMARIRCSTSRKITFAEATASDLNALAACIRVQRQSVPAERLAELNLPVLVAVGENDGVAGSPAGLARLIPGAELCVIPRRDHMQATGDRVFKERVLGFLHNRP